MKRIKEHIKQNNTIIDWALYITVSTMLLIIFIGYFTVFCMVLIEIFNYLRDLYGAA